MKEKKIVGAICHGPIILARTIDPQTEKSVIYDRKVTSLTKKLERIAYYLSFWKLGKYYRTYPDYVQDEVIKNLSHKDNYVKGGGIYQPFVFMDHNLITARWPNDIILFSETLVKAIKND